MDRIRGIHVVADKPDYDDPGDVLTPPAGFFNKDPGNPPTQATADFFTMMQEELRNLVVELGGTPASNIDNQIATLLLARIGQIEANISALQAFVHGNHTAVIAPCEGTFINCGWEDFNGFCNSSGAPWAADIPLQFRVGTRIKSITTSFARGSGSGSVSYQLRRGTNTGSPATVVSLSPTITGTFVNHTLNVGGNGFEVAATTPVWLHIDGAASNERFTDIRVTYDQPA